ncbi:hypothetical protein Tamer19_12280 [Cupriavidus sp. TA19]|uniref:DNA cytosine methyltransferase n=1 Tax=unclassified Cupriavidus TaxID=2640874 RepID=UPI000E2F4D06|nr:MULTISPECIES: DNA cytosine methyltransferase [unclassified Cupriavidus]BDB30720.1 DNA cytosine methyltransferase [Cupriavidus sp. P-10]GLC91820.1 hypothetical protein Tamer19_12280 [Cupriavidus sp. TA19]
MDGYFIKTIGANRGKPRVWLQGLELERAGFGPGQSYEVEVKGRSVVLTLSKDGTRTVTPKQVRSRTMPVIDLNSNQLLAAFDGMAAIRMVVKDGQIYLLPLASELKKQERLQRLRSRMENGEPLRIGSLSHGGGIMSHAIHAGLQRAGLKAKLEFANEIRPELLEHASEFNDAWSDDTVPLAAPMQELAFDDRGLAHIPKVEILEAGIPCSGASRAGTAKRGLKHPEAHPEVGHLVVAALVILNKAAPAIVAIENVPTYANTASASILRSQLRDLGYTTHERILNGKEWGAIENRDRWCMVAVTQGIDFDFDQLMPPKAMRQVIGDLLEDIPADDARWGTMRGLVEKEARDLAAGKNFKMQIYDANDENVGTLTKGYAKIRSTDPKLRHRDDPSLMRQFTATEHARFKQIPSHILGDASETMKHEMAGQSVIYEKFADVGHHIGNSVNRFAGRPEVEMHNRVARGFEDRLGVDQEVAQLAAQVVADLRRAEPGDGRYVGPIVAVRQDLVVQKIDDVSGILHQAVALREMPKLGQAVEIRYRDGSAVVMAATNTPGLPAPTPTDSPAVRSAKERLRAEIGSAAIPDDYNAFDTLPKSTRLRM